MTPSEKLNAWVTASILEEGHSFEDHFIVLPTLWHEALSNQYEKYGEIWRWRNWDVMKWDVPEPKFLVRPVKKSSTILELAKKWWRL